MRNTIHAIAQKPIAVLFSLSIVVTFAGCSDTIATQSKASLLIGSWKCSAEGKTNVITYHADGTFGGTWETGSWGIVTPTAVMASGNWTLTGDTVKYTITKHSFHNTEMSNQIFTDTIMSINDRVVVFRDETAGGVVSTWVRQD